MPPAKSKAADKDDSKSETPASTGKDKKDSHGSSNHQTNGKSRRTATTASSQLRDVTSASSIPNPAPGASAAQESPVAGLQWTLFDRQFLHTYRRAYRLPVPAVVANDYHRRVLSQPGSIGLRSPTMARQKESRRQSKEQLANAARKHFNSLGAQENEIIAGFLHKIKNQIGTQRVSKPRKPDVKGAGDTR